MQSLMLHLNQNFLDKLEAEFCQAWKAQNFASPEEAIGIFLDSKKIGKTDGRISLERHLRERVRKMEKIHNKWQKKRPKYFLRRKIIEQLGGGQLSEFQQLKAKMSREE